MLSFPSRTTYRATLIFVFLALSRTVVYIARPRIYGASTSSGVPVYVPAVTANDTVRLPDTENSAQLSFTGTELYRFEVPIGRNANF